MDKSIQIARQLSTIADITSSRLSAPNSKRTSARSVLAVLALARVARSLLELFLLSGPTRLFKSNRI